MTGKIQSLSEAAFTSFWGNLVNQAISFTAGILVVRHLSLEEYGLYTIALSMLGMLSILSDSGIGASVLQQGGKVWQDPNRLGAVLATALSLRRKFLWLTSLLIAPVTLILLIQHQATWPDALLMVIAVICLSITGLKGSILGGVMGLHQKIKEGILIGLQGGCMRLLLLVPVLMLLPKAFAVASASLLQQWWANRRTQAVVQLHVDFDQGEDPEVRAEALKSVKRLLPGCLYYCISGQILTLILSILGTTATVGQLGGLGRIAQITLLFNAILGGVIVPRYARIQDTKLLMPLLLAITGGTTAVAMLLVGGVWLFSEEVLWVLGVGYQHLQAELVVSVATVMVGFVAGAVFSLGLARGWVTPPLWTISVSIGAQIVFATVFDLSTLMGVQLFGFFTSLPNLIIILFHLVAKAYFCNNRNNFDN